MRLFVDRFDEPLPARSRDLGPAGIFVEAGERLAVGTPVVCEVTLPSGPMRLAGLVAREQLLPIEEGPVRIGLGIQFVNIAESARAELNGLIPADERTRQLVAIHLEGMRDALRSQAAVTPDGLKVSATLPFLREGGHVKVAFLSGAARVESRTVVRDVRLVPAEEGAAPRLEMRLQFLPAAAMPPEQDEPDDGEDVTEVTAVDTPSGIASASLGQILAHDRALINAESPGTTVRTRLPAQRRSSPAHTMSAIPVAGDDEPAQTAAEAETPTLARATRTAVVLAAGLALIAIGAGLNRFVSARSSGAVATHLPPPPAPPGSIPKVAARVAEPPPGPSAAEFVPSGRNLGPPRPAAVPAPANAARRAVTAPPEAAATAASAAASGIVTLPVGTPGPTVSVNGDEIIAVVPVDGSTEGGVHYALTQPRGLAIDLPKARAALPIGRHAIFNDGFRFISVREREGGGLLIAFTYAYHTPKLLDVSIEDASVRVRVAPPPAR